MAGLRAFGPLSGLGDLGRGEERNVAVIARGIADRGQAVVEGGAEAEVEGVEGAHMGRELRIDARADTEVADAHADAAIEVGARADPAVGEVAQAVGELDHRQRIGLGGDAGGGQLVDLAALVEVPDLVGVGGELVVDAIPGGGVDAEPEALAPQVVVVGRRMRGIGVEVAVAKEAEGRRVVVLRLLVIDRGDLRPAHAERARSLDEGLFGLEAAGAGGQHRQSGRAEPGNGREAYHAAPFTAEGYKRN